MPRPYNLYISHIILAHCTRLGRLTQGPGELETTTALFVFCGALSEELRGLG